MIPQPMHMLERGAEAILVVEGVEEVRHQDVLEVQEAQEVHTEEKVGTGNIRMGIMALLVQYPQMTCMVQELPAEELETHRAGEEEEEEEDIQQMEGMGVTEAAEVGEHVEEKEVRGPVQGRHILEQVMVRVEEEIHMTMIGSMGEEEEEAMVHHLVQRILLEGMGA